jgi:hypothetical protein
MSVKDAKEGGGSSSRDTFQSILDYEGFSYLDDEYKELRGLNGDDASDLRASGTARGSDYTRDYEGMILN